MARRYSATQQTTIRDLQRVMTNIGATSLRIEQEVLDGSVKLIFDRHGRRYVRECSKYESSIDNLRAIGLQIEYLYRALDVLADDIDEASFDIEFETIFGGFIATPDDTALLLGDGKTAWHDVLGVKENASVDDVKNAYRALVKIHHPDNGGLQEDFIRLREAYDKGIQAVKK